jgi:hypothetical protein
MGGTAQDFTIQSQAVMAPVFGKNPSHTKTNSASVGGQRDQRDREGY